MNQSNPNQPEGLDDLLFAKAQHYARHIIRPSTAAILTLLGASIIMWLLNGMYKPLNMLIGLVMVLAIAYILSRPKIVVFSLPIEGFFAFLRDDDVSQGAAGGLGKLSKLGLFVIYVLSMNAIILATWSFWNNGFGAAMSYWGLWLVTIAIGSLSAVMGGGRFGSFAKRLQMGYLILVALSLVWNTIDLGYALPDKVSDAKGNAIIMFNPQTSQIVTDLSPADCKAKACYASDGIGVKLIPLPAEEASKRNPRAWVGKALNASESPMFWPLLIVVTMGAGYGFYRTRSAWGLAPAIGIGLLCVSLYPLVGDDAPSFATEARGELFAASAPLAQKCEGLVSIGSKATLTKSQGPCLNKISERVMLVPVEERYYRTEGDGKAPLVDWSNRVEPKLRPEAPAEIEYVVAKYAAATDLADRDKIRFAAGFDISTQLAEIGF